MSASSRSLLGSGSCDSLVEVAMPPILMTDSLSHSFGPVSAVVSMSLEIEAGGIVGLIGPNGCGKTTLFNCISGRYRPSSGEVVWQGREITGVPMRRVVRQGLVRTFQEARVFPSDTTSGNVERAMSIATRGRRGRSEVSALPSSAGEILRFCGIQDLAETRSGVLPFGSLRQLGIAMAMATGPAAMLLDEPAAGLNGPEAHVLGLTLRRLHDCGVTLVVVDHDMGFIMPLVDRLVVMVEGRKFREGSPEEIRADPEVITMYLGSTAGGRSLEGSPSDPSTGGGG